ncbi:hypothetical protein AVEN_33878-1 [Araneus ventricosus]|uniref:Uncharacterized protein n=1 Tax=Araneus ventricosus TaxID=182803 RepID=A0A4Y2JW46_ARAVE|nr:hypothetical protein AVEN_33878-1 [Araneus ventricosus]
MLTPRFPFTPRRVRISVKKIMVTLSLAASAKHFSQLRNGDLEKIVVLQYLRHANSCESHCDCLALNNDSPQHLTLSDANAVAKSKLRKPSVKKTFQIYKINEDRNMKEAITRLRTSHFRSMRIDVKCVKTYAQCSHCPDTELPPSYIFDCPAVPRAGRMFASPCGRTIPRQNRTSC